MPDSFASWIGLMADIIGVGGALFALMAWTASAGTRKMLEAEKRRLNEPVKVVLQMEDGSRIELPALKRKELTRAELLGRIGMLPRKDPRAFFVIDYLSREEFFNELARIQDDSGHSEIVIYCTEQEKDQFKLNNDSTSAPSSGVGE